MCQSNEVVCLPFSQEQAPAFHRPRHWPRIEHVNRAFVLIHEEQRDPEHHKGHIVEELILHRHIGIINIPRHQEHPQHHIEHPHHDHPRQLIIQVQHQMVLKQRLNLEDRGLVNVMLELLLLSVSFELVPGEKLLLGNDEVAHFADVVLGHAFVENRVEVAVAVLVVLLETESTGY